MHAIWFILLLIVWHLICYCCVFNVSALPSLRFGGVTKAKAKALRRRGEKRTRLPEQRSRITSRKMRNCTAYAIQTWPKSELWISPVSRLFTANGFLFFSNFDFRFEKSSNYVLNIKIAIDCMRWYFLCWSSWMRFAHCTFLFCLFAWPSFLFCFHSIFARMSTEIADRIHVHCALTVIGSTVILYVQIKLFWSTIISKRMGHFALEIHIIESESVFIFIFMSIRAPENGI